jgi:hypothetical protein
MPRVIFLKKEILNMLAKVKINNNIKIEIKFDRKTIHRE